MKLKRDSKSHKGQNGKVLIIGGSKEYTGAVVLAGLAALRSGIDWITIAAPEKVAWAINCLSADLITIKLGGDYLSISHYNQIKSLIDNHDVLLIGNGAGLKATTKLLIRRIVKSSGKLKVIDADAIKCLSIKDLENSIITPHAMELEIFLTNSSSKGISKDAITKRFIAKINKEKDTLKKAKLLQIKLKNIFLTKNVLLLKGPYDAIISDKKIKINKTGNAGMTKAGTGDVLAGLCAGFLAQTKDLFKSAEEAARINGLIGDILLKKKKGFTYLASDMVEEINKVVSKLKL